MKVQVYTITKCGYCQKIKLFLDNLNVDYEEVKVLRLGEQGDGMPFTEYSRLHQEKNLLHNYTFPQVFVDNRRLGGILETIAYFKGLITDEG